MPTVLRRFARFAVVGVIATATHAAVFAVAIEALRIEPVTATALAFVRGGADRLRAQPALDVRRAWRARTRGCGATSSARWRVSRVNSAIMYAVVHVAKASPYLGLVLGIVTVPPLTFALNQLWVFRPRT